MPWYDYHCNSCNHEEIDVQRKITEDVSTYKCPKCGSDMAHIIGSTIFKLSGTGWAKDGYSSKGAKKSATKES